MEITFGTWLALKRKQQSKLTQQDLADLLDVKKQTVSTWERDISAPALNPDQTAKLCLALDVSIFELQAAFLGQNTIQFQTAE